jgi:hypothetical protein
MRGAAQRGHAPGETDVPHHAKRPPAIVVALTRRHIGIPLPAPHGFEFVAMDTDFELLDGSSFRRLEQLEEAAQSMARAVTGQGRSEVVSVPIACSGRPAGQRGQRMQVSTAWNHCL